MKIFGIVLAVIVAFLAITTIFGSWYTIDQGERGVLLTNGRYTATIEPGLHFKYPWVQDVVEISTRQQVARWICDLQAKECQTNESGVMDSYVTQAYSRDQQVADLQLSITWHVPDNEIENVYANYGSLTGVARRTIWRKAPSAVKTVFGQYDAVSSIQQRAKLNQDISDAVTKSIDGPVVVDAVQIENIDFSTAYENAVEARMTAQVEVQKREQELAQEKVKAQIAVTQAEGRAKSVKAEADAAAYRTRIEGEAAADAIKARAAALAQNAELVELTKAERWNGQLPSTMIPGTTVPFMDMAKQ